MDVSSPNKISEESILERLHGEACTLLCAQGAILGIDRDKPAALPPATAGAYLLGTLLWQVRNGGWRQWCGNGYVLHLRATRDAAAAVGMEHSAKVAAMLDDLEPFVDLDAEPCGSGGRYFKLTEEQREIWSQGGNAVSDGERICQHFDRFFYRFDKAWEDEVIAWLKAGAPGLEFRNDS